MKTAEQEVSMHPRSSPVLQKIILSLLCAAWLAACAGNPAVNARVARPSPDMTMPSLLPLARQIELRESWLAKRHAMLLALMRKHGVGMWLVVNEEFHDDPLTEFVAPPRPYCGNRDIFVFVDGGDSGLQKLAVLGSIEENVGRFFELSKPGEGIKALKAWDEKFKPQTIALGIGGRRGATRSLTHDTYNYLVENLGKEAETRFISAASLVEEYLDTRLPDEFEEYAKLVRVTEVLARRALSNEVIVPGKTTVGDVRRWLYSRSWELGLRPWFQPDLRIQRRNAAEKTSRGFLRVAEESTVIQRGDVVHLDFGLNYMGLNSDWQKMLYILREGEADAPAGLKKALTHTNAVQDAVIRASRPDKPAGDVYEEAMAELKAKGITAQVYSHPLGNQGHALGASIDFRSAKRDPNEPGKRLRRGSYLALELNSQTEVPEWNGQKVTMMAEDPVYLSDEGWKFFRPRQETLYLVR
jgi:Xaa-Pro dipeptidase